MKFKKLIDAVIVLGTVGITAAVGVPQILNSYADWQKYYEENMPEIDPATYSKLMGITAELKEGVEYFANSKANPTIDDFTVTAHYKYSDDAPEHAGEEFDYWLDPEHYTYKLTVPSDFSKNGGDLVITYNEHTSAISYTLIPVVLEKLEVISEPYTTVYEQGTTFKTEGLVLQGIYNDGATQDIDLSSCTISKTTPLAYEDKAITISYIDGETTLTTDIKIKVVQTLNNGSIKAIGPDYRGGNVRDGQLVSSANLYVLGTYESGNKKLLGSSEYTITNGGSIATLGRAVSANVVLASNNKITAEVPLYVTKHIEGESSDTSIVGGKVVNEEEYKQENGSISLVGNISSAGDFVKAIKNGSEASLSWNIMAATNCVSDVTLRCANSNLFQDTNEQFWMKPLQINTIADLYINNELVPIEDDVILAGCGPHVEYAPLYNIYSKFTFKDINLVSGVNSIKLKFKFSTINEINHWNESPSTMNVDYIEITSLGTAVDENVNITEIFFDDSTAIKYGDNFDTLNIPVFGIIDNDPEKVTFVDPSLYTLVKPTGIANIGKVTIEAYLNKNTEIRCSKEFTVGNLRVEAESGTLVGNNKLVKKSEEGYEMNNGILASTGTITYIGGFDNSTTKHSSESSITLTFNAAATTNSLIVRCSNSYVNQTSENIPYAQEVALDQCVDIYLNGTLLTLSATIPAIPTNSNTDALWNCYFTLQCCNVTLKSGQNTIKIVGSKTAPKNMWTECSAPRFDWIEIGPQM